MKGLPPFNHLAHSSPHLFIFVRAFRLMHHLFVVAFVVFVFGVKSKISVPRLMSRRFFPSIFLGVLWFQIFGLLFVRGII